MEYKVLVIDQSGRGHALCDLIARGRPTAHVFYGPGNHAVSTDRLHCVPEIDLSYPDTALSAARRIEPDLTIVSNIEAIRAGFTDVLRSYGWKTVGATQRMGMLETSKQFTKEFLQRHGVNTPRYRGYANPGKAIDDLCNIDHEFVIKADGLCLAGDGVKMVSTLPEAKRVIHELMEERQLGEAGQEILIEERLVGSEFSAMVFVDEYGGYLMLPPALDYKRSDEGNTGVNCAGMGSVFPHPLMCRALENQIDMQVVQPVVRGLLEENSTFTGFFFIGGIVTHDNVAVFEINSRFGDSEAEAMYPGIQADICECFELGLNGRSNEIDWNFDGLCRVAVSAGQGPVRATNSPDIGWPHGPFVVGNRIRGLEDIDRARCDVFYASVDLDEDGHPVTSGGRVAHFVGKGESIFEASRNAYDGLSRVSFDGMSYRKDIGLCL